MSEEAKKQKEKGAAFRALHEKAKEEGRAFVIPNPWDAGSARILTALGFEALATTSAGAAFTLGHRDGVLGREGTLENARQIVAATHLPVSADLENGFGDKPEDCAETIRKAAGVGLVGGSIEDYRGEEGEPIYGFDQSVERVAAAVEAARSLPFDFTLTARAENHIRGRQDLGDTIKRLQAYEKAGADVLYAPGLKDIDAIREVCAAVSRPVNVVMGLAGATFTVKELGAAGVARISVGSAFARAALGALVRAAQETLEPGTFTFAGEALPMAEAMAYMKGKEGG